MEILRADDDGFRKFGQVYMTTTYPGVVKAWHLHKVQDDNFCCVKGMVKLVLFDGRDDSPTRGTLTEYFLGDHNTMLARVPAGVHHGWKCVSTEEAIVINAAAPHSGGVSGSRRRAPWMEMRLPRGGERAQRRERGVQPRVAGRVPAAVGRLRDPVLLGQRV